MVVITRSYVSPGPAGQTQVRAVLSTVPDEALELPPSHRSACRSWDTNACAIFLQAEDIPSSLRDAQQHKY